MRKHYTTKCKEKIADLEGTINFLSAKIRMLEPMADEMLKKYKDEERQRKKHEEVRHKAESETVKLRQIIEGLESRLLNQTKLEEELKKANSEIKSLQKKLHIRLGSEAPYGLSTPSSKVPNKKNSSPENQAKRGGAKKGHKGYGRKGISPEEADSEIKLETPSKPCSCGCENWELLNQNPVSHSVIRFIPSKIEKEIYYKYINKCTDCGKTATANTPGVFPRSLYSNSMIAHLLTESFFWGHTVGSIERKTERQFCYVHLLRDVKKLKENIFSILGDKKLRNHLQKKGYSHVKKLTWDACSENTLSLYKHLLNSSR